MLGASLIPISDDDSGVRRFHFVVWLLLLFNIGAFLYEISLGERELARFVHQYGAIPFEITRLEDIPPFIDYPVLVTLFTSMFLHGGFLHIGANMLFLWIFGDNIEDAMGHFGFLLFYILCGLIAAVAQVLIDPSSRVPIVGASGAISGVMGAYLVLFPAGLVRVATIFIIIPIFFRLPAIIVIGLWFFIQLFSGYASLGIGSVQTGTAYFAHIGGFLAGVLLVWIFADPRAVRRQNSARRSI